ncbi:MAG: PAS domain-containing sensor histidine kinase [Candidatus Lokiarchaeota archaeon]
MKKFIRTHCIFNNITERKQLEIKLRKSEEKYRSLVETSPNSIILLDLTGDLIDSNKVAEKYFQLKRDNIIGENLTELGHEFQEIHSFLNKGLKILKTSSSECFEFNLINTSGEPIYLNNHISKVKIGDEEYIQIVSEDITERKRAEKIVKNELKRLKEIKNIKNAFLIRASHELKTPLNSISSSVNLFQNLYGDKLDERGLRLINIIENGGTRLNKLIQDLLDVISIEKQKFKLEREKLDIVKMLNNCLKNLKNLFKKRNLEKEFYENREMEVYIDRIRIEQVFTNILMNSIKNTPPKGLITILIKKHSHFLDVIFKDNGIGFTKEEKKKIFKRFGKIERNGNGLNVMDEGAGLGLFLAKKIVEQHGGNIWVKSKGRNEGTMVTVRLPL